MDESRYMFDQLAVLSPIMLALSAATPIHRGMLADTDVRWNTISASVDDRTEEELLPPVIRGESEVCFKQWRCVLGVDVCLRSREEVCLRSRVVR